MTDERTKAEIAEMRRRLNCAYQTEGAGNEFLISRDDVRALIELFDNIDKWGRYKPTTTTRLVKI